MFLTKVVTNKTTRILGSIVIHLLTHSFTQLFIIYLINYFNIINNFYLLSTYLSIYLFSTNGKKIVHPDRQQRHTISFGSLSFHAG
jgi:hypothetical protein